MTDELSLDDALAPDPEETEQTTGEAETEETETEVQETEETEESESESAKPADSPSDGHVPLKALTAEREKRQAAERKLAELQAQSKPESEESKPKTSVFEDEEKAWDERLRERDMESHSRFLDLSREMAADTFGEEVVSKSWDIFYERAQENPEIAQKALNSAHPYKTIVKMVEGWEKETRLESLDDEIAKAKAEGKAEALRELQAQQEAQAQSRNSVTPSLASARSAESGTKPDPIRIETAEEVFPE